MNQSKKITDGAILTTIYVVILFMTIFIPVVQIIGIFLLSVPFVIYTAKHGFKSALLMAVAAFIVSLLVATVISIPMTLLASFGGVLIGQAIYLKKGPYETLAFGSLGFILSMVAILVMLQYLFAVNIFTEMDQIIDESLEMSKTMMQAFPSSVSMDEAFELVEEQMRFIKNLIPAIIILLALLLSFIGQWVSYKILNRIEQKGLKFPPFKFFNFPLSLIWVYLITIMLTFVDLDVDSTLYFVLVNAEMICVTFLTIQGFSFLFFYAHHKKWHRSIPIVLLVVSIILPFLMYIIRIVGIIDLGLSLKKKLSEQGQGK